LTSIVLGWLPHNPREEAAVYRRIASDIKKTKIPIAASIVEVMSPSIVENFRVGGRPKWAPLSTFTKAKKGHDRILFESGKLARSTTGINAWNIDDGEASLRGDPKYGVFQNEGFYNVRFGVNVPAREWAVLQSQDIDKIVEVFAVWLTETVR